MAGPRASRGSTLVPTGPGILFGSLLLALIFSATALEAHQRLLSAEPASGSVLMESPESLRLVFLEPLELAFTNVEIHGPGGEQVQLAEPRHGPAGPAELIVSFSRALRPGTYTVHWQTTSRDGHPVRGNFEFEVDASVATPGDTAPSAATHDRVHETSAAHESATARVTDFDAESPLYVAIRWLGYLSLLVVIGSVVFALLVLSLAVRESGGEGALLAPVAKRAAASVGSVAAVFLVLASVGRLFAQAAAVFGPAAAFDGDRLQTILLQSSWGTGWLVQMAGGIIALFALIVARRERSIGWIIAMLALPLLVLGQALGGHASAVEGQLGALAIGADAVHLLSAGGWLGTLLVLLAAGLPAANGLGSARRSSGVATLVRSFSPIALVFAALLVATGVFAAWVHLGSFDALTATTYGKTLLVKLALFVPLLAVAAYNFRILRPALGSENGTNKLRRSAGIEILFAVLLLLVTAVLVATPSP